MTWVDALVLGLVQGLTEFLPISSSGHLVLTQELLGVASPGAALEIAVHLGTLGSVLVYYRRDLVEVTRDFFTGGPERRTGWLVIVATLPTVVFALLAKSLVDEAFEIPEVSMLGLLFTGLLLLATRFARRRSDMVPGVRFAVLVGLAQMFAITPGISRSGSTIGMAMFLGDDPVRAARFSFLLSIPAIAGAAVLEFGKRGAGSGTSVPLLVLAGVVAFVTGWAAIAVLITMLGKGRLAWFGPYCIAAAITAAIVIG